MEIYLVGGAVREKLLGLPVTERDWVVVGATPEQMLALGYRQVGKDFPVFLHPETKEEYALARTERKTGPGYYGFDCHCDPGVTLKEDLLRRDLTINAMAEGADGQLIDYYGGLRDLRARVLRHVSPAFAEDPLRILRVARFAARYGHLGFRVSTETVALMRRMVGAGEVDALVPERVWQELVRALGEPSPRLFFEMLKECGALERLFPELDRLWGVPQPERWHPEIDTGIHTMMVLEQVVRLSGDTQVRFAALTHDLGKGTTPAAILPRHIGHEERGVALIEGLCRRIRVPKGHCDLARLVARYHGQVHRARELRTTTLLKLLEGVDALRRPQRFEQFLLACEADYRGRKGFAQRPYPQADLLRRVRAAAAGADVAAAARDAGCQGDIREAVRRVRLRAIASVLDAPGSGAGEYNLAPGK